MIAEDIVEDDEIERAEESEEEEKEGKGAEERDPECCSTVIGRNRILCPLEFADLMGSCLACTPMAGNEEEKKRSRDVDRIAAQRSSSSAFKVHVCGCEWLDRMLKRCLRGLGCFIFCCEGPMKA